MSSFDLFSSSVTSGWSALGWTVIHFLWQGALIGLFTAVLLDALPRNRPSLRYLVASGALLLSLLAFVGTFLWLLPTYALPMLGMALPNGSYTPSLLPASAELDISTVAAWCWSFGVAVMAARLARHWLGVRRLKSVSVSEPNREWKAIFLSVKRELGVDRTVRFLQSSLAETPMVVGWIAPVILVPVSAFTALTPDQLRSILAHELAHIRRHDYLLNMVQCAIESVLFFHPITWWISKQIRQEREACCDDASILSISDRRHLAEALTQLESLRLATPITQISANGGSLMNRISRILEMPTNKSLDRLGSRAFFSGSLALLLIAAGLTNLGMAGTNAAVVENSLSFESQDDEPITREDYGRMQGEMARAVKSGWLSREEMKTKLGELRGRIAPGESKGDGSARSFTRSDYARAQKELDGLVAEGKVSREDADKRLSRMRQAIGSSETTKSFTREDYALAAAKIKKMVAEGKVSPEDARRKLGEMRLAIGNSEAPKSFTRSDYARVQKELDGMVAEGKISPEDAKRKLGEMRQAIGNSEATKAHIEKSVKSGEMTRAEADELYKKLGIR
jgi:beta-lactamase regulating signal transducer with metallopeptidase domain/polyhydroxyalkanoate synthesis regulator phasin